VDCGGGGEPGAKNPSGGKKKEHSSRFLARWTAAWHRHTAPMRDIQWGCLARTRRSGTPAPHTMVVVSAADWVHNRAKGVGETAMKHMTADFSRIIAGVRDGSQQAAGDLLAEYGDLVLRVVRRRLPQTLRRLFDSHDFAQVVWGSIFRHRSRLNRFNTADEFVAFVATVAANKVRMEALHALSGARHLA
jgi:hypothetical protein